MTRRKRLCRWSWARWCRGCETECPFCLETSRARALRAGSPRCRPCAPAALDDVPTFPGVASTRARTPFDRLRPRPSRRIPGVRPRRDIRSRVPRPMKEHLAQSRIDRERARRLLCRISDFPSRRPAHVDVFVEASWSRIIGIGVRRQLGLCFVRRWRKGVRKLEQSRRTAALSAEIATLATPIRRRIRAQNIYDPPLPRSVLLRQKRRNRGNSHGHREICR